MKLLLGLLFVLNLSGSYASEPVTEKMSIHLYIAELCDVSRGIACMTLALHEDVSIELHAEDSTMVCEGSISGEQVCEDKTTHYRGLHSSVAERGGLRYISVVTVDKFIYTDTTTGVDDISYRVQAEILGDIGVIAKLLLNVDSLDNMNSIVLEGPVVTRGNIRFQSNLQIGRPVCTLYGGWLCDDDNNEDEDSSEQEDEVDDVKNTKNLEQNIDLIMGSYRYL